MLAIDASRKGDNLAFRESEIQSAVQLLVQVSVCCMFVEHDEAAWPQGGTGRQEIRDGHLCQRK